MNKKTKFVPYVPGFSAHASPVDYRDIPLAAVAPTIAVTLPSKAFIDVSMLPVWHQHKLGACVGHAGAKYRQKQENIETAKIPQLSARFLYALAKCRDGVQDEGTYPRLVASILKDVGCATETTVPNDTLLDHETYVYNRNETNIPSAAWEEAKAFKISGYAFPNVKDLNSLKSAVVNFSGAMLLLRIGAEWYTSKSGVISWLAKDVLPLRIPSPAVGGHEVYLYGYEDVNENGKSRTKMYIFNSWSTDWGDKGMGYFYFDEYAPYIVEAITHVDVPAVIIDTINQLPTKDSFKHNFNKTITLGQQNTEVVALQTALMIDGEFNKDLYSSLLKTSGLGYYGITTAKALYDYQVKYKVSSMIELNALAGKSCGPKTRAHLNNWTNK
jgi:hypothetical protein